MRKHALASVCAASLALGAARPAAATYSIVARDPKTGEIGVAVQSHWFSVGAIVTWAEAGVGAIATQANADPGYGPRALALLRTGRSAQDALAALLKKDAQREVRQVAIVDAQGRVAAHTGKMTIAFAGHQIGDGYSVQANIMANSEVWPAMARAYESARGPLADRLLAALDAAQEKGGDIRGKQSAAILVVGPRKSDEPWREVRIDLRVDDSREPLVELRRLYRVALAYERANDGDALTAKKDFHGAAAAYIEAARRAPENDELLFWAALSQAADGRMAEAVKMFEKAEKAQPGWRALLPYLRAHDSPGVPLLQKQLGIEPRSQRGR